MESPNKTVSPGTSGRDNNALDESRQEPVSGVSGDTTKGEPFDAGNMDSSKVKSAADPQSNDVQASPAAADDTTSGQNDTREPDKPETDPEPSQNDVDLKQPGPKPLKSVAGEHGGDAGNIGADGNDPAKADDDAEPEEDENGVQKKSHGSGTGEQWVKSSGLKADGGDFDAAAPGAGREADRLLETKGIKKDDSNSPSNEPSGADGNTGAPTEKPSVTEKIKSKLHVH